MSKNEELEKECNCTEDCHCGKHCECDSENKCSDNCTCGDNCKCGGCDCEEECKCGETCECEEEKDKYLILAQQVQADFDNFRRRSREEIERARMSGQVSVIEAFLPCLDTFKEAKKLITDESVLQGVEMIENKILSTLKELGVEKIESIGQVYSPHLHNAIAVMRDESKENNIILEEFQAGYKYKEKVIRYAKVIVNKKEG